MTGSIACLSPLRGKAACFSWQSITFPATAYREWVDLLPEDDTMVEAPERQVGRSIGAWLEDPRRSASDKWRPA